MQYSFSIRKLIDVIYHFKRIKAKIFSIDAENNLVKFS